MSMPAEQMQTNAPEATQTGAAPTPPAGPPKKKDSPSTQYIRPQDIPTTAKNAIDAVIAFAKERNLPCNFTFDFQTKEIPEGFGIIIAANQKRDEAMDATITTGYAIGICPDIAHVVTTEKGNIWAADIGQQTLVQRYKNSTRPGKSGTIGAVPESVEDFITVQSRDLGLAFFNENAQDYVGVLRDKGLSRMTKIMLRDIMQSAPYAQQHYPSIPQATWTGLINHMINNAKIKAKDPGILTDWLTSRADNNLENVNIDLSDFAQL